MIKNTRNTIKRLYEPLNGLYGRWKGKAMGLYSKTTITERARRNEDGSVRKRAVGTTRVCSKCEKELPESEFYFSNSEGKYQSKCIQCYRAYSVDYRKRLKQRRLEEAKEEVKKLEVKPNVTYIAEVKSMVNVGERYNIYKKYYQNTDKGRRWVRVNTGTATVESIGKNSVLFKYIRNGTLESFCLDDVIRIRAGVAVEG